MHTNNVIINNNYGSLQDLILLFKIFMGTRKSFFEIYRQFGHAPSKRFASPGLQRDDERVNAVFLKPTFAYTC
jgi:hypothetical protein